MERNLKGFSVVSLFVWFCLDFRVAQHEWNLSQPAPFCFFGRFPNCLIKMSLFHSLENVWALLTFSLFPQHTHPRNWNFPTSSGCIYTHPPIPSCMPLVSFRFSGFRIVPSSLLWLTNSTYLLSLSPGITFWRKPSNLLNVCHRGFHLFCVILCKCRFPWRAVRSLRAGLVCVSA